MGSDFFVAIIDATFTEEKYRCHSHGEGIMLFLCVCGLFYLSELESCPRLWKGALKIFFKKGHAHCATTGGMFVVITLVESVRKEGY